MRKANASNECIGVANEDGSIRFYSHLQQKFVSDSIQISNVNLNSFSWSSSVLGNSFM
jgi:hypothetical protein